MPRHCVSKLVITALFHIHKHNGAIRKQLAINKGKCHPTIMLFRTLSVIVWRITQETGGILCEIWACVSSVHAFSALSQNPTKQNPTLTESDLMLSLQVQVSTLSMFVCFP